jgi:transcriptional regulator with XRE-family HTH domain
MADKDPRVIGARIARRRHQLDWSQVELARRLGVSPSTVANWERGASYPKKKLGKVELVLGISLDDEPPPPELPTPEEMDGLRDHIREVLGDKGDRAIDEIDRAVAKDARAKRSAAGGMAGPARRQAS